MYTKKTKNIAQNKNRSRVLFMFTCNTWFVLEDELNQTQYNIVLICKIDQLFLNKLYILYDTYSMCFLQLHLIKYELSKLSNQRFILLPGICAKIYVSLWSSIKWKIASCNHNLEHETHLCFKTTEQGKVFAKNIIIRCINIFVGKVHIELHAYFNYACGRWGKIVIMNHKWNMPTYH